MNKNYESFVKLNQKIAHLGGTLALLHWDQEAYMPKGGASNRGEQTALIEGLMHEWSTGKEMLDLVHELDKDTSLTQSQKRNLEECKEAIDIATKFSTAFVEKRSQQVTNTFHAWLKSRETKNFNDFAPDLEKLIQIKKEEADITGYTEHPYDALLFPFEKENTVKRLDELFADVRNKLKPILDKVLDSNPVDDSFLQGDYDIKLQEKFTKSIVEKLGYNFTFGRQDEVVHPFCTTIGKGDVRITTHYHADNIMSALYSSIHEAGHALYEQGLNSDEYGMPLGSPISMSVHESQSRFWENNIGRSKAFWQWVLPNFKQYFNTQNKNDWDYYKAANKVKPSLIRIEADELTYHFHIMIRYEIEKELIAGSLQVKDIPEKWNTLYKAYLNQDVPDITKGCVQDVHWSHGYLGYFPTYSQGSFMAAQWQHCIERDLGSIAELINQEKFSDIVNWLKTNIHQYGKFYTSKQLCEKISGEPLNVNYFIDYASKKYSEIYS